MTNEQEALRDATAFVGWLTLNGIEQDGTWWDGDEFCFHWKIGDDLIEVGFAGDGMISWWADDDGNDDLPHGDQPFDRTNIVLDKRLVRALLRLVAK